MIVRSREFESEQWMMDNFSHLSVVKFLIELTKNDYPKKKLMPRMKHWEISSINIQRVLVKISINITAINKAGEQP